MKVKTLSPAEELFLKYCKGYKERDLKSLLNLFTKNTSMWGSGIDEFHVGLKDLEAQFKRDWSQSEKAEIEILGFVPAPEGALWAAATCKARVTIDGQEHVFENLRGTLIMEKEGNEWKIAHTHASFPDMRNPENGSFPTGG